jgi:integrase
MANQRNRALNRLTDKEIQAALKNAKALPRPRKLMDGGGLSLIVTPKPATYWRVSYRYAGREKMLSLGVYPTVSLAEAREKRDAERKVLAAGRDPSVVRQEEKAAKEHTFCATAYEWFAIDHRAPATETRDRRILSKIVGTIENPSPLGKRPLAEVSGRELLSELRSIEKESGHESAHRACGMAESVFAFAIATGKAQSDRDPTYQLRKALKPVKSKSHAAITKPAEFAKLLRKIDDYQGSAVLRAGLQLLALLFTRPGELRQAKWSEFDLDAAQWVIPAERMKMRKEHVVPLPARAVEILRELRKLTGEDREGLVFATLPGVCISENGFRVALMKMGYDGDKHTAHGFRSSASTLLHELSHDKEVIETQLAHSRPGVGGVYNRSHLLAQRRELMTAWADYLDGLRKGDNVVAISKKKSAA